jgi:hypothetical protein
MYKNIPWFVCLCALGIGWCLLSGSAAPRPLPTGSVLQGAAPPSPKLAVKIVKDITLSCEREKDLPMKLADRIAGNRYRFPYLVDAFVPENTVKLRETNRLHLCDNEGKPLRFGKEVIAVTVIPRGLAELNRFYSITAEPDPKQPNQVYLFALAVKWHAINRMEPHGAGVITDILVQYRE